MSMGSTAGADTPDRQATSQATNTGLDEHVATAVCYALGWVTGIIMYFVESDTESVRFHAAQSIVVFGGYTILLLLLGMIQSVIAGLAYTDIVGFGLVFGFISAIFGLISMVVWGIGLVVWLYLLIRSFQGGNPQVPGAVGLSKRIA